MEQDMFKGGNVVFAHIATQVMEAPIKTAGAARINPEQLQAEAEIARECLVPVDYFAVRGTCIDERYRAGLRNGTKTVEDRPSVPGGPNIHALAVAELIGSFADDDESTGQERLKAVTLSLERARIRSGGHDGCAANGKFAVWMNAIATAPEAVKVYAKLQLGTAYDESVADFVVAQAQTLVSSGRYAEWNENVLGEVLGSEAGEAIEQLGNVEHESAFLIRNRVLNTTESQNMLYDRITIGRGAFVMDDGYADVIENVLTSGPNAVVAKQRANHAREMILAAVAGAVPNPELYQITLS